VGSHDDDDEAALALKEARFLPHMRLGARVCVSPFAAAAGGVSPVIAI